MSSAAEHDVACSLSHVMAYGMMTDDFIDELEMETCVLSRLKLTGLSLIHAI
jgi:hypothetical protein